jgi:hypothetical protein
MKKFETFDAGLNNVEDRESQKFPRKFHAVKTEFEERFDEAVKALQLLESTVTDNNTIEYTELEMEEAEATVTKYSIAREQFEAIGKMDVDAIKVELASGEGWGDVEFIVGNYGEEWIADGHNYFRDLIESMKEYEKSTSSADIVEKLYNWAHPSI